MKSIVLSGAALACCFLAPLPSLAHHSFAAEYDQKSPFTFKGVVTKLDWMNPHVYFYVDLRGWQSQRSRAARLEKEQLESRGRDHRRGLPRQGRDLHYERPAHHLGRWFQGFCLTY